MKKNVGSLLDNSCKCRDDFVTPKQCCRDHEGANIEARGNIDLFGDREGVL